MSRRGRAIRPCMERIRCNDILNLLNILTARSNFRGRGWDHERGSMGSESLNWRSTELEVPPVECNTDPVRSLAHGTTQIAPASLESRKVESGADHQDYVNYLRTAWSEIDGGQVAVVRIERCEPSADLLPPLDLKTWTKERETSTKR